jgi:hypothetical protein
MSGIYEVDPKGSRWKKFISNYDFFCLIKEKS